MKVDASNNLLYKAERADCLRGTNLSIRCPNSLYWSSWEFSSSAFLLCFGWREAGPFNRIDERYGVRQGGEIMRVDKTTDHLPGRDGFSRLQERGTKQKGDNNVIEEYRHPRLVMFKVEVM